MSSTRSAHGDARLAELAAAGSDRAFEAIVHRYRRPMLRYCSRLLPGGRAEDAVQQALVKAHAALRTGTRPTDLSAWLFGIAHNEAVSGLRQRGWGHEPLDASFDGVERPDEAVERRERLEWVVRSIEALPERQREAIVLRELEGRSYEEIAARLDVSLGSVRQLLNRARNALRAAAGAMAPPFARLAELLSSSGAGSGAKAGLAAIVATGAIAAGIGSGHHGVDPPSAEPPAAQASTGPADGASGHWSAGAAPTHARQHSAGGGATHEGHAGVRRSEHGSPGEPSPEDSSGEGRSRGERSRDQSSDEDSHGDHSPGDGPGEDSSHEGSSDEGSTGGGSSGEGSDDGASSESGAGSSGEDAVHDGSSESGSEGDSSSGETPLEETERDFLAPPASSE
jgi:RNA polymerase sigma factor (sigma-70 family)